MTPPLPPETLHNLLRSLPPLVEDPFPHLSLMSPEALLRRRIEITGHLKVLEQERQAIDQEIQSAYGDAELRNGICSPGWILKQRSRTSWNYSDPVKDRIRSIQRQAQKSGDAVELSTTYLVLTQVDS